VVNDLGVDTKGEGESTRMADQTVAEIEAAGGTAVASYDSVATREGGEAIVATALDHFGRVDVVVNNAGVLRDKSFARLSAEELDLVLDVHLKGAFYVSQPAYRCMKEQGYGRFIFTTSPAGLFGNFGQANYGAAKMGVVGLSNVIALEGAKSHIHSNVISPGATTRLTEEMMGDLRDVALPECVVPLVVYLASEECELTHEVYSAAGGCFSRVFVGLAPPWFAGKGATPSAEEIRAHLDEIQNTEGFVIPKSVDDESAVIMPYLA
jgi:NAD(P)-dependent dehydrogenase (short-subunit alcohol dehydrogenase family)